MNKQMIDKYSKVPLYMQIKEYLLKYINGNNNSSLKIPSENELSKQFKVSRPTIRLAIDNLVNEGLVEKIQGKGTFIKINKKSIHFANWQSTEENSAEALEYVLNSYQKIKPDIVVHNVGIKYKNLINTLIELVGYGNAPDIMSLTYLWIPFLVNYNALYPLNDYYSKEIKKKLYPQSIKAISYKNNYYGFNWANGPHILYYNKNILFDCFGKKDLGFKYYDDFSEYLNHLYAKYKGNIIPLCLPFNNTDLRFVLNHFIYIFLFSFEGGIVNERGEIVFNSENNIKAFTWLKSFINKGHVELNLEINDARKVFADGKMAFWIDGPWYKNIIPTINKKADIDVGFRVLPKNPSGLSYSPLSNHILSVSNQSKNKEIAIELIKYITMDKGISEYYYKKTGMLPASKEEIDTNPAYDDEFGKVLKKQMETAVPIPDAYPGFPYAMNFCTKACREIFIGDKNIISVLNNTVESIKEIYNN